ncbi:MAG: hypothetical protein N3B13_04335 [Deltaproteobacteria bacterium]|nr:hypothetical protein [Deltaproteobacteria bacterium]
MSVYVLSNILTIMLYSETYYHLRVSSGLDKETETCYSCHTSIVIDKKDFLPVILERQSVHFRNNKFCTDCHREENLLLKKNITERDRIFSVCPFYKKIRKDRHRTNELCGGCHQKEYEDFISGVHKNRLDCTYCHSNHGIKKASLDIIRPDKCSSCHRYPDIAPVRDEFRKAETVLLATESHLAKYRTDMPELYNKYSQKLNIARMNMKSQRHRFSRADITSNSNYILLLSGHIRKEINSEAERTKIKKIIYMGIALIIILALTGLLYYLYQYYKWRRTLNKK